MFIIQKFCLNGDAYKLESHDNNKKMFGVLLGFEIIQGSFEFELENVISCTYPEGAEGGPVRTEVEYLTIHQLPIFLAKRYHGVEKIYVRECYRQFYETVSARMLSNEEDDSATLFTGVPGIGKSLFMLYFIYRYLGDDRFNDKSFAVELMGGGQIWCLEPSADAREFTCILRNSMYGQNIPNLLLCDIHARSEPLMRSMWTFIFSYPDPCRYKQIMKNEPNARYTMPTWSLEELMNVKANMSLWEDKYELFGGVPRHVFGKGKWSEIELKQAVFAEGGPLAKAFSKSGIGAASLLQSDMLVHVNPPLSSAVGRGPYLDVYSFASDYVFRMLAERHRNMMLAGAADLLNRYNASEMLGFESAGNLFEKVCLWLKPLDGDLIYPLSLEDGISKVRIDVPDERYYLPNDWKKTEALPVNMLIVPRISNPESGVAFFMEYYGSDKFWLVVLQITVAESHPVKVKELVNIINSFPGNVGQNITEKLLVFVTHKSGALKNVQPLRTAKN